MVERLRVVDRHAVVLSHRDVREESERLSLVVRLVQAAVASDEKVVGVLRIDPERVVVDVLVLLAEALESLAGIL